MKYLNTQILDQIYNDRFIAVDLVEIHLKDQQGVQRPLYLTNGNFDIIWDSPTAPTAGDNRYTAQGEFMNFTTLNEEMDVKVGKFGIGLSAIGNDYLTQFTSTEVESKRVVIYKAFLEYNTLQIIPSPICLFDGLITNVTISENDKTCGITIDCATLFSDFERSNGRYTNTRSNWLYQGYEYDKSFEKSGWTANTEIAWGRTK